MEAAMVFGLTTLATGKILSWLLAGWRGLDHRSGYRGRQDGEIHGRWIGGGWWSPWRSTIRGRNGRPKDQVAGVLIAICGALLLLGARARMLTRPHE